MAALQVEGEGLTLLEDLDREDGMAISAFPYPRILPGCGEEGPAARARVEVLVTHEEGRAARYLEESAGGGRK